MPSSDFLQPRLDAPDHNTRMIQLKRAQGQPLARRDLSRLATRMSVEESTLAMPQGGQVQGMLPREQDPARAYQKGYEGTRRLFTSPGPGAATRTGLAPAISGGAAPTTGVRRATPSINIGGKAYPETPATMPSAKIGGTEYAATAEPADDTPAWTPDLGAPPAPPLTAPAAVPQTAIPATPTTAAAPQTESNNPLSGDTNRAPGGATTSVNPAQAAGFSRRGSAVPAGNDHVGGTGLFARRFSSPQASDLYTQYVRRLFGNEREIA